MPLFPCTPWALCVPQRASKVNAQINCLVHRRLTSRQQSLILSYAEEETDVEGTVNGVTTTSTGRVAVRVWVSIPLGAGDCVGG